MYALSGSVFDYKAYHTHAGRYKARKTVPFRKIRLLMLNRSQAYVNVCIRFLCTLYYRDSMLKYQIGYLNIQDLLRDKIKLSNYAHLCVGHPRLCKI